MPQMSKSTPRGFPLLASAGLAVALSAASAAHADLSISIPNPNNVIVINAKSASGAMGQITVPYADVQTDANGDVAYMQWATSGPETIGGIATLVDMSITAAVVRQFDGKLRWVIDYNFNVSAGAEDTTFELISPLMGLDAYAGMTGATVSTSGTLGGTDTNGNGITITPAWGGTMGFAALLNGSALPGNYTSLATALAGSSLFQSYFNHPVSAAPGLSAKWDDSEQNMPEGTGFMRFVPGAIFSMQSIHSFKLTAGDDAGGTSTFFMEEPIPAPASIALVGLGGLLAARRRR